MMMMMMMKSLHFPWTGAVGNNNCNSRCRISIGIASEYLRFSVAEWNFCQTTAK